MKLFGKREDSARSGAAPSILPDDLVGRLADFGRFHFDPRGSGVDPLGRHPDSDYDLLQLAKANREQFLAELAAATVPIGGWTVYGAMRLVWSFGLARSGAQNADADAIRLAALSFVHDAGYPAMHLSADDFAFWRQNVGDWTTVTAGDTAGSHGTSSSSALDAPDDLREPLSRADATMSPEQLRAWLDAIISWRGKTVLVSVENRSVALGAVMQFYGVLGHPEVDGDRVWVPVLYAPDEEDDRSGFGITGSSFESWDRLSPYQIRVIADGMAINVFPSHNVLSR